MNTVFSFGSYYAGSSVIHALDPRVKFILSCLFIGIVLSAQDFIGLGCIFAFVVLFYALAHIPAKRALQSLAPLLAIVFIASILNLFIVQGGNVLISWWIITISEAGVYQCLFIATRLVLMMMGMSLLTLTTTTLNITEAFERLLQPLNRFGVPTHELGMIMGIALRFMPQFADEFVTVYRAQISRGAKLSHGPLKSLHALSSLMVPLFASAFRHAETLSEAMDARCYHGGEGRTRLHPLHCTAQDGIAAGVFALLLASVVTLNILI